MRVLLVEPHKSPLCIGGEDISCYEPLALEYLAAGVSKHHDVRILDLRLERTLPQTLESFQPDVVGITAFTVHVNTVRALFDQVKAWNARILTVVGGHHATVAPQDFVRPTVDLIVQGEGVRPFQEIVARLERGEGFDGIPGVAFARSGNLVGKGYATAIELDQAPFPERRLTAQYRAHYSSEWMHPLASVRTSKGCPFRCSFCTMWTLTGGCYLRRQPEKVVEELAGLAEPYVFFADDESLVDTARMKTLASLIREAGIQKRYFLYGRSDTIARNPDLLAQWRDVGLERIFVGLECFRDEDLKSINKGSTLDDNKQAVRILCDLGIQIWPSFIVRQEFTSADFLACRQYVRDLGLNFAGFAMLTPLPGTEFYEEVKERLTTDNYDLYDFFHTVLPTALPLQQFHYEYYKLASSAVPLKRAVSLLRRWPLHELPATLARQSRWLGRMRAAHRDYDNDAGQTQGPANVPQG
jgi:hopanoid C-3 methylase